MVAEKDHVADTVTGVAIEQPGAVIHLADHLEESKPGCMAVLETQGHEEGPENKEDEDPAL